MSEQRDSDQMIDEALKECDRLVAHFAKRAARHKKSFKCLSTASIVLAATVTAISGTIPSEYQVITTVVAALATICTGILASSQAQHLWGISRSTSQQLVAEKFLFLQGATPYSRLGSAEERARVFSEQIVRIWNQGHSSWQQKVLDDKSVAAAADNKA